MYEPSLLKYSADKPLLSSTAQNKDEAANDIGGVETASLNAQLAQLTAKQPDSDLLIAAQDLDFF